MDYSIKQQPKRKIAGFHLVGPWEQTVKQGFEQLAMWVDGNKIEPLEWVAVYYDNPDEVPAEKLRCDTAVTVPEDFQIPANSEGVILTEIAAGDYAVAVARVENHDFGTPWYSFFNSLLEDNRYGIAPKPCFERYLNDGNVDGYWDIEMYVAVQNKVV
ncbi:DNA gyrase inhibitor SbmC [Lelliottia sp. V89_10]|uniref:DNA gyrase inhibitor SbmC n=1 Tax=Lelliottia wanjuensis TaxID=3050585 RepID=UPI00249EC329|nr:MULTISPECIES: DNA gyrase inhibitor SbmC [unclassified Lelliottia]MDI3361473.1 DNA gyrase inhibitor SbmC [Lelliottia sp. V89_13]MDK9550223.1 DNA gyrase inhibitor SbmC [Lelliottia sp. V89_5]MDK9595381.1 DNA gyrase inhibitor SbmC [Lelliottia sp. V89_10]